MRYVFAPPRPLEPRRIPWVLFGLLAQPREDTGLSPAEAMFGAPIALLNEFLQGDKIYATLFQN
jgi:hypothetical protein